MITKTQHEKEELMLAKFNYKKLQKNKEVFTLSLHEILATFSKCKLPDWGSFKFNGQRV
jgi:hypothetical protein